MCRTAQRLRGHPTVTEMLARKDSLMTKLRDVAQSIQSLGACAARQMSGDPGGAARNLMGVGRLLHMRC